RRIGNCLGRRARALSARRGGCPDLPIHPAASLAEPRQPGDPLAMDQHATDLLTRAAQSEEAELDTDARAWLDLRSGVPSVWSRYTDLVVERGQGSWIETIHGDRYLDYTSGIGVTSTGHAHPRISAAIADQAAHILHAQQNILYHNDGLKLH